VTVLAYWAKRTVPGLLKGACVLGLVALALVVTSVLLPRPLFVILAMSVGHGVGAAALACYVLAVILDSGQRTRAPDSKP